MAQGYTSPLLPSGSATAAKQDAGNASLASIDGKITAVNTGAVVVSSSALPTGAATAVKQDAGNTSVASIDTKTPVLGQALAAASVPVVLTAAQLTTLTPPAAITGFATETTLATRLSESDFDTKVGSLTETAPTTDTASSGLNGRLQRIAQRITSLITAVGSPFQAGGSIGNTSFASTQSGTWTVQPGNTANTTAWKVDGSAVTQPVSGTVSIPANSAVNVAQINGVTPLMGNGATGTGSQRVTVASDNTPFAVKIDQTTPGTTNLVALTAETTKAIGVVRNSDGAGNLLTSNSVTYTARFALDTNLLGTLGTAFSTAGKVDIKGTDGDVFVRQATGTNLHMVVDSGTVTTVSTVTSLTQMNGQAIAMGTGTRSAGTQRVTIATDDIVPASQSGTWTVQPGNTANTTPWYVTDSRAAVGHFQTNVTTAGTRVQLASNACASVTIKAKSTNTGAIYVGNVAVTSLNGFILNAGESISMDITNTNLVYIDSAVNGEGVSSLFVN